MKLLDAGWKCLNRVTSYAKKKTIVRTIIINTNNSYCLLSIYYVPDSLLSILYASLYIIFLRTYEENSAIVSILHWGKQRIT